MENHVFLMDKSTISMPVFNSNLFVLPEVNPFIVDLPIENGDVPFVFC